MNATVFLTVLSGVLTYVAGQLVLKLVIEPVHELRKTIGLISHVLIERANVIQNPGVPTEEVMDITSQELRKLSSLLQSHLYLVPKYDLTARVFRLPSKQELLNASSALIGLSNSVYRATGNVYEVNAKRVETVCDSLGIYLDEANRWPKELK
jgi:hypothetical protein